MATDSARDLYLAAYDVVAPRRLRAALDLMRGYATGGQYSVHECWLTAAERAQLVKQALVSRGIDAARIEVEGLARIAGATRSEDVVEVVLISGQ